MKKLSRNDLCWCGSSKKYKVCHLEHDQQMQAKLALLKKEGYEIPSLKLIKSKSELDGIRKSCQLTKEILDIVDEKIRPGITTNEINTWVHEATIAKGAYPAPLNYRGFPKSVCTSINEIICHGIPNDKTVLKDGDIINVDVTCMYNGFYGDASRMYCIGNATEKARHLVETTKQCLELGMAAVKPYKPVNVIGEAIEPFATQQGYSVVTTFGGHGIGCEFHQDPFIYHFKVREKGMIMVPNMVFTIEPMINEGKPGCKILKDNWTAVTIDGKLSAQWEHTIVVTETGFEILTA